MKARISDGSGGYLHCAVSCAVSEYFDSYDSVEECLDEILFEVATDCVNRGYNEHETNSVLKYYEIKFHNSWKN